MRLRKGWVSRLNVNLRCIDGDEITHIYTQRNLSNPTRFGEEILIKCRVARCQAHTQILIWESKLTLEKTV